MVIMMKMSLEHHGAKLIKDIKSLSQADKPNNNFSDIQLKVGHRTFYCHKLVLQLNSDHFAQHSFTPGAPVKQLSFNPDQFFHILNFMYTGDITLTENNIESVLNTADSLQINDLKELCFKFVEDHLIESEPVQCWKLAITHNQMALAQRCRENVISNIKHLRSDSTLLKLSEEIMKQILCADNLNVSSELEVCDMFMKWFDLQTRAGNEVHPELFLPLIRWSGVSVTYIKSKLLQNITLMSNEACMTYLSKVINYHLSGVQFEGLQTFQRTSTKLESCVVVFGLYDVVTPRTRKVYRISIQQMDCVSDMAMIPVVMDKQPQACTHGINLFITGVGCGKNETWKLDTLASTWFKCADMITARRRHCAVIIDILLYVLSGRMDPNTTVLSSVECYNIVRNEWSTAGDLLHAVQSAACVVYRNSIYIFGGVDANKALSHVQVYNPADQTCKLLDAPMPAAYNVMRAVLWETSVILLGRYTCLLYNFETNTWLERKQFKTEVFHFGLVLDNQTIYIIGGGTSTEDKNTNLIRTGTDKTKSVSVVDIIEDSKSVVWKHHAQLPQSSLIHAYCKLTLPTIIR